MNLNELNIAIKHLSTSLTANSVVTFFVRM